MLIIRSSADMARALDSPIDPDLKRLLALRRDQLMQHEGYDLGELAQFIVVTPGDSLLAIEAEAHFPLSPDPPWEWVLDHGHLYEAPIILSDDGFGVVLIVPKCEGIDQTLLSLLRDRAERAAVPES